MARISKSGLDYFPLDVNFLQDRKVRRISSRHHAAGIAALTSLFCLIYKEKGYYVPWNQDTLFDVAQEACCEEAEMQAIIDDCLAVGLFDPHIYKVYSVLTSQVIQEQYHKIITDSRRKYKLPLEHFWLITDGETEQQKDEYGKENSIAKSENENRNGNRAGTGNGTVSDAAVNDVYATKTGINAAKSPEIATTIPQTKEETDTKGKQETEKERDRGTETKAERDRDREKEIEKDKETENRRKAGKETENEMPPVPSNGVFQAPPVVVSGLSFGNFGNYSEIKECYSEEKGTYPEVKGTYPEVIENPSGEKGNPQRDNGRNSIPPQGVTAGGSSETLLHMNLQTIGIRKEQTVNAITALARRKELGGPGGTLWKILSNEYRPTLLKKNEPGDYITVARKAKGKNEWFVGGITDENSRTATIPFSWLPEGKQYIATIYEDGKDADWDTNPQSYQIRKVIVTPKSVLKQKLAASGGVAISIKEADKTEMKGLKVIR